MQMGHSVSFEGVGLNAQSDAERRRRLCSSLFRRNIHRRRAHHAYPLLLSESIPCNLPRWFCTSVFVNKTTSSSLVGA